MIANNGACGLDAVSILGVAFDRLTIGEAILRIENMIESRKPHYVVTANMDFVVQARGDVELRRILMDAHLVLCDGTPLVWASKLLGNGIPERVAGSDLTPLLLSVAAEKSYKVFILGGTPKAAEGAAERILEKLPDLKLTHYSPPFHMLLDMNHDEIRQRILEFKPDILLVSFGCPKQEKWIAMHYRELGVPVSIGVGATIDFLAGQVRRAPVWMQRSGFEWMFRLSQEPGRLFGRYSRDMFVFGSSFLAQLLVMRTGGNRENIPQRGHAQASETPLSCKDSLPSTCRFVCLPETLDHQAVRSRLELWTANESSEGSLVLDASQVALVDSTGLALLIRLKRTTMARGAALVILSPSRALERILAFARLQGFFLTANSLSEAQALVLEREQDKTACVTYQRFTDELRVWWKGEVTAANTSVYADKTCSLVESNSGFIKRLRLELVDVPFIDSTGLGTLIRIRKVAARQGLEFCVAGMQPAVQNVVRLANLESVFLPPSPDEGRRMFHVPRVEEKLRP